MPDTRAQSDAMGPQASDLPDDMTEFQAYGLWDGLNVYDTHGCLRRTIAAHPGRFFPADPAHYVESIRAAVLSDRQQEHPFWPVRADIDITQRCTNNCYFCYATLYTRARMYRDAEMSAAAFESIVHDLAAGGTKVVRFTGGGEPLLHPGFRQLAQIPRRLGLRSCVITNGTLLDDTLDRLLVENLDHVRVSVNAATEATWARIHRPALRANGWREILTHVERMARLREAAGGGARRPLIWITYLLLPENAGEIYAAARAVRECGADSISFRSVYHDLSSPWTDATYRTMSEELARAGELHAPPTFQVFTPRTPLEEVWRRQPQGAFARCFKCHLVTFIEATNAGAQVKLCDVHRGISGDEVGRRGLSLGTVAGDTTFPEVWHSRRARSLLRNRPEACGQHCIAFTFNRIVAGIWDALAEDPGAVFRRRRGRPLGYSPLPVLGSVGR